MSPVPKSPRQNARQPDLLDRIGRLALLAFPIRMRRRHGAELVGLHRDLWQVQCPERPIWRVAGSMLVDIVGQGLAARHEDRARGRAGRMPLVEWGSAMDTLLQDVRFALRTLAKMPGVTLVSVASLALGIGANAAVFSMVNAYLLRPLPYEQPHELYHLWGAGRHGDSRVSVPNFLDWRDQARSFADMAAFNYTIETLTGGEFPEQISGGRVSANAFDLLGEQPLLGRAFAAGEDSQAAAPVALLSESFWRERYSADPGVLGRTLEVDQVAHTVVGVVADGFNFPLPTTEVWLPRALDDPQASRSIGSLQIVGRLADGATVAQAAAEMDQIAARLAAEYPEANEDLGVRLESLRAALNFAYDVLQPMSALLVAAVGFVLLIACANVGNLLLSRAAAREREVAVRAALGAGRGRLVRQMLTETTVIAVLGGVAGLLLAVAGTRLMDSAVPRELYRVGAIDIDTTVLLVATGLSLLTAALAGLVPALRSSRTELVDALKDGTAGAGAGRQSMGLQRLMVSVEMSLAIVLLVGTALMIRTLGNLQRVDPGFTPDGILTMRMLLPESRYGSNDLVTGFHRDLVDQVGALPGVTVAATVNFLPLNHEAAGVQFGIQGEPQPEEPRQGAFLRVSPEYFGVMDVPLLQGRQFGASDTVDSMRVAVIDQTMAQRYWPDRNPVGSTMVIEPSGVELTIIGVVGPTQQIDLSAALPPMLYLPMEQSPSRYLRILARTPGDPEQLAPAVRDEVKAVDALLAVDEVRTMEQVVEAFLMPQQMVVRALGGLAVGALLLASIGVYGLMAFYVSQRTRDIGIHVALGATANNVRRMIVGTVLRLTGAGVVVGLVAAYGLMRLMSSFLYGVGAADPLAFAATALFLVGVAVAAGVAGARRATRVDPIMALRAE